MPTHRTDLNHEDLSSPRPRPAAAPRTHPEQGADPDLLDALTEPSHHLLAALNTLAEHREHFRGDLT